ncbi:MAG TPA: VOC family protein, partial [Longimicrobiales bacterium]|nr:VOC family protein [Longimicrobiales bacterium]
MITKGFHHITLVAAEATRTIAFYRDLLGISLIAQQSGMPGEASSMLYFGNGAGEPGTLLVVAERPHVANGRPGAGGIHHFALTVETPEAQLMWKRRLQDHGV